MLWWISSCYNKDIDGNVIKKIVINTAYDLTKNENAGFILFILNSIKVVVHLLFLIKLKFAKLLNHLRAFTVS